MPAMAGCPASPMAVKTEQHSHSVLFTYFKGDIGSMVDAHFTRALSRAAKPRPGGKSKKTRKSVKSEPETNSCQWGAPKQSWSEDHFPPMSGRLQLNATKERCSTIPMGLGAPDDGPAPWTFVPRQGGGLGLPPMPYSHVLSQGDLGIAGQQYTNSLLNLLHSDRPEMALGVASGSKPNMLPSWTGHPSFRDPTDPAGSLDSGIALEKKDLYWY